MDRQTASPITDQPTFKDKHRFFLFIVGSIGIATTVVVASMSMYNGSGAAQLDLSRPGYKSVRSKITANDGDFQNYSSSGVIDKNSIKEFRSLFDRQSQKTKSVDAFGGDPLSPEELGIAVPI